MEKKDKDILSPIHLFCDLWSIWTVQEDVSYAFPPNCMSLWGNLIHTPVPYYIHHCPTSLVVKLGVIDLNSENSTDASLWQEELNAGLV